MLLIRVCFVLGDKRAWAEAPPAVPRRAGRTYELEERRADDTRDSGVSVDAHAYTNADDHRHHQSGKLSYINSEIHRRGRAFFTYW